MLKDDWPKRIVCLTAETTEIIFALGAGERIVGVSGYTVRPPEARLKERVAAFTSVRMDKIRALQPDLIFAFSDLQKDIVRDLTQEGYSVFVTNQRSLKEIGEVILAVGRLLGLEAKAEALLEKFTGGLDPLEEKAKKFPRRLRVYFEEWDDPLISGIQWVSEIIRKVGGEDIFGNDVILTLSDPKGLLRGAKGKDPSSEILRPVPAACIAGSRDGTQNDEGKLARQRIVTSEEVIRRNPEVILASWCGKKVQVEKIRSRPGWEQMEAVRQNRIYEIKSADILQPGLSLLEGARQIFKIFQSLHPLEGNPPP